MATESMIKNLSDALVRAKEKALSFIDMDDGGTCNLDTPQIFLSNWRVDEVKQAVEKADLMCYIQKSGKGLIVDLIGCTSGQGFRRTQMAEAVRDSLKYDGYESFVYYNMD